MYGVLALFIAETEGSLAIPHPSRIIKRTFLLFVKVNCLFVTLQI